VQFLKKESDLEWNIKTHNKMAKKYEKIHIEIYNSHEQLRLKNELNEAITKIKTKNKTKQVLDFGCGAGNLTKHLVSLGCDVIACDVSQGFLDLVSSKKHSTNVEVFKLNGIDLLGIPDESVDMVATYSVLHHVPDYLAILKEFSRVLKSGGIIYIDHENSEEFWNNKSEYQDFLLEMKQNTKPDFRKYFVLTNYYDWIIRRFINPKYHREGDIHVFKDDHIEWGTIIDTLLENGGQSIVFEKDYLLFRGNYNTEVFNKYKNKISDMHVLAVRKQ